MPLLNKRPFLADKLPENIDDSSPVFYLPTTNEIFLNYDDYFKRQIELQSMIWACSYTGKTNLTFEEAVRSEKLSQESVESIPDHFGSPILFLVHYLTHRGRLDDLVNDIYTFVRDRYFVGEIVNYGHEGHLKKIARVLSVAFIGENFTLAPSPSRSTPEANDRTKISVGQPVDYRYTIQIINKDNTELETNVREDVIYEDLSRPKSICGRVKLKLFLKMSCQATLSKLIVKPNLVEEKGLDEITWNDVFGGPLAIFPRTPLMQRGPVKGYRTSQSFVPSGPPKTTESVTNKKRDKMKYISDNQTLDAHLRVCSEKPEKSSKETDERKMKKIKEQQEELQYLFSRAESCGVKNLKKWRQNQKLLRQSDINALKDAVRCARKEVMEIDREKKKKEKEIFNEWRKSRDDLLCDDLKMLPKLEPLSLPSWLSSDDFGALLRVYHFFGNFSRLLPIKEVRTSSKLSFTDILTAVKGKYSQLFLDLLEILLRAKNDCASEEDGDEADLKSKDELITDANCDLANEVYGKRIRDATLLHENIRDVHGLSARHLPIDRQNITEVIRLNLLSSGYFTGRATHRFRHYCRGGLRFYEDAGFIFAHANPKIMETLARATIFDLSLQERLALLDVFMQQLCSYNKFRSFFDELVPNLLDLRRELRILRTLDTAQEKEAREAKLLREYEAEQNSEIREKPIKACERTSNLLTYLRLYREGITKRRDDKSSELREMLLVAVPYSELGLANIEEVRLVQKEFISEREQRILSEIFKIQERLGWNHHLGYDRAHRSYWFIDSLSLFLVESASSADEIGTCSKATPLDKVSDELRSLYKTENELREHLNACTNHSNCPVHSLSNRNSWYIISSLETFQKIKDACNPRGVRERNLAQNLEFYESSIVLLLDRYLNKAYPDGLHETLFCADEKSDVETFGKSSKQEFIELLLDFEEKVESGGIGHLAIKDSAENRMNWRQNVLEGNGVANFANGDLEIFTEKIMSINELSELDEIGQLALAFLQVVQGISLSFLRTPFAEADSKENMQNRATTTFDHWQKSLLKVSSISALSLFYTTIDCGILWRKSLLQAKCRACRRRNPAEKLILCVRCDVCYHYDCIRPKLQKIVSDWICFNCLSIQKASEADERRKKHKTERSSYESSSDHESASLSESSSSSYKSSQARQQHSKRTIVLRSRKRAAESVKTAKKKRSDSESESDSDSSTTDAKKAKKRKQDSREIPQSSRCLRESNRESRDKLRALESVISDAMKHPDAWPFTEPVDGKSVPDYYQVIKRPMDLGTMMNKLKQMSYDNPEQVVADSKLIFSNCRIYNHESTEVYQCANKLEVFLEQKFDEILSEKTVFGQTRSKRIYARYT